MFAGVAPLLLCLASTSVSVPYICDNPSLLLLLLLLQMIQQGTNNVYPEVEGLSILLNFKTQNAGCCKVRA
jgi:hypothetical protein